eukprot:scaffold153929_cov31-Tisochrysis_lutea.AAC.5
MGMGSPLISAEGAVPSQAQLEMRIFKVKRILAPPPSRSATPLWPLSELAAGPPSGKARNDTAKTKAWPGVERLRSVAWRTTVTLSASHCSDAEMYCKMWSSGIADRTVVAKTCSGSLAKASMPVPEQHHMSLCSWDQPPRSEVGRSRRESEGQNFMHDGIITAEPKTRGEIGWRIAGTRLLVTLGDAGAERQGVEEGTGLGASHGPKHLWKDRE